MDDRSLEIATGIVGAILIVLLYLLPLIVAWRRRHASIGAIAFVNIALGWTVIGWLWAMIWSLTGNVRQPQH